MPASRRTGRVVELMKIAKAMCAAAMLAAMALILAMPPATQAIEPNPKSAKYKNSYYFDLNHYNPNHKCSFCHITHKAQGAAMLKKQTAGEICGSCHSALDISSCNKWM